MTDQRSLRLQGAAHDEFGNVQSSRGSLLSKSARRNSLLPANTFDPLILDPSLAETLLILTTVDEHLISGFSTTYPVQLAMYCHEMTWSSFIEDINGAAKLKFGQKLLMNIAPMLGKLRFHKAAIASQFRERLQRLCNVLKYWKDILKSYSIHIELKKDGIAIQDWLRDLDHPSSRWHKRRVTTASIATKLHDSDAEDHQSEASTLPRPPFMRRNDSQISIASIQSLPGAIDAKSESKSSCWELIVSTGFRRRSQLGTLYSQSRCVSTYSLPQSRDPRRPSTVGMLSSRELPPLSFGQLSDQTMIPPRLRTRTRTVSSQEYPVLRSLAVADARPSTAKDLTKNTRRYTMVSPLASGSSSSHSRSDDSKESVSSQSTFTEDNAVVVDSKPGKGRPLPTIDTNRTKSIPSPKGHRDTPSTLRLRPPGVARDDWRRHSAAPDVGGKHADHTHDKELRQSAGQKRSSRRISTVQAHSIDTIMASADAIVSRQVSERGTIRSALDVEPASSSTQQQDSNQGELQQSSIILAETPWNVSSTKEPGFNFELSDSIDIHTESDVNDRTEIEIPKAAGPSLPDVEQTELTPTIRIVSHDEQDKVSQAMTFRGLSPLSVIKRTISSTFTKA